MLKFSDESLLLYIQEWNKLKVKGRGPPARSSHSACCITDIHLDHHHPVLVVVGGDNGSSTFSDMWLLDVANKQWKKVSFMNSYIAPFA